MRVESIVITQSSPMWSADYATVAKHSFISPDNYWI